MAVDISTDLNITLLARDIQTPTISGSYDAGSPPGTYLPGKDFSPTDDVSTGTLAQLNFSIAFDSISNQLYTLDRVYIQSVDDPRIDGAGMIPGRWINQDPNPMNITDDGQNTIIPNYFAQMSSIVFDETANIQSDSTVTTGISATLPFPFFWWKSKIMPKIQVVAVKDGIQKVSAPLQLPTIRLSSAALLTSSLLSNGNISYSDQIGLKGFYVPIAINTVKDYISGITRLADNPDFDLITYEVNFGAAVNGTNIPLTAANFQLGSVLGTLVSLTYTAGVLRVVIRQNANNNVLLSLRVFVPFDAGTADQATVTITGDWQTSPPTITDFINRYLFTETAVGNFNREVVVDTSGEPPVPGPIIRNNIFGQLTASTVSQTLDITNYPCFRSLNSLIIRMIDSPVAQFGPNVTPRVVYFTTGGTPGGGDLPASAYVAYYGHYDFPAVYDPNAVAQLIFTGGITLMSYADVIALGQTPNIMAVLLIQDVFAGQPVDTTRNISFTFNGDLDVLTQAEFAALYQQDPRDNYPTWIYNYMNLGTCYNTVAEAYAAVGDLLSSVDSFGLRANGVFLTLGTTAKELGASVQRFNAASIVRTLLPLETINAAIEYSFFTMDGRLLPSVTDYTKEYCLLIRWGSIPGLANALTNIPANTTFTITLPDNLRPFIYLSGQPFIRSQYGGPEIPIPDYRLNGNQLAITTPLELNMQPDTICAPVKFLTPSASVTASLTSLVFSNALVYKENPDSLLYGFTTDSLLFKVSTVTRPITLVGAQIDTTGLVVVPEVYDRGQAVTYIATVYNESYAPSSDYCMSITAPTNQYNPVESSNNTLPAFITAINPTDPRTVVYFQTAANATAMDIHVMKTINRPGGPTLQQYFDTVIVNSWVRYTGQALPADVVMLVGCTDDVVQNSQVRIDYDVVVQLPPGDNTIYTNDAVFNYYSSGANLEAQSNMVTIRNRVAEAVPIVKTPPSQLHPLENGVSVPFTLYFTAPSDPLIFKSFTITDQLHPSIRLNSSGGVTVTTPPGVAVPFTSSVDAATNTVTIRIDNSAAIAGKLILVDLAATVVDAALIPYDPAIQLPAFYNTGVMVINDNPALRSETNPVLVIFYPPTPVPVPIVKAPPTQTRPRANGATVDFTLTFTAPALIGVYTSFLVTDALHPSLTPNLPGITVDAGGAPVVAAVGFDPATNTVSIGFPNTAATSGKVITIHLPATVTNEALIPAGNVILNTARLTPNNNPQLSSDSNTVEVRFTGTPVPPGRCQAITDVIQSVALEQTALAHILNAEGEKLQKALSMPLTPEQTLEFNRSVYSMVESIATLESILKRKLNTVGCNLCDDCPPADTNG